MVKMLRMSYSEVLIGELRGRVRVKPQVVFRGMGAVHINSLNF